MAIYRPGDASKQNLAYAEEALDAFAKYSQAFPNEPKIQDYILSILLSSERYDEALTRLRARSAQNPGDKANNLAIATVLIRAGRLDEALAYVKSLGARADSMAHYTVGVACFEKVRNDKEQLISPEQRMVIVDAGIEAAAQVGCHDPGFLRFSGLPEPGPATEGETRSRPRSTAGLDRRSGDSPGQGQSHRRRAQGQRSRRFLRRRESPCSNPH